MKLSARNQISGKIVEVQEGAVNAKVVLETKEGMRITATLTEESVRYLSLHVGMSATAIFKANAVMLAKGNGLKLSARNQFVGKVLEITKGPVSSEVIVAVGGDKIVSSLTLEGMQSLELSKGDEVVAIVKASALIMGV
ncbi:MAG: TOBE domain-containing protein [Campylobacterales bacterium]|nr:TOBE domain-containing protein [Campylobacterales bacterium]